MLERVSERTLRVIGENLAPGILGGITDRMMHDEEKFSGFILGKSTEGLLEQISWWYIWE